MSTLLLLLLLPQVVEDYEVQLLSWFAGFLQGKAIYNEQLSGNLLKSVDSESVESWQDDGIWGHEEYLSDVPASFYEASIYETGQGAHAVYSAEKVCRGTVKSQVTC